MFGFLFQKKRDEVRRLLANRMNTRFSSQFRYGLRKAPRGSFCEVVWVIPYDSVRSTPRVEHAFPVVTKDICSEGLSLIHTTPINEERIVVGLEGTVQMHFLLCHREHSTPLGYGYYQIGVHPEEVLKFRADVLLRLKRRMAQFRTEDRGERKGAGPETRRSASSNHADGSPSDPEPSDGFSADPEVSVGV
ncbi:MAG TPA: hypothetical protein EYP14_17550 [Planctomycetaceae bacterium]|nr:hypothetical protein [Planctomycetaceae bacterium]